MDDPLEAANDLVQECIGQINEQERLVLLLESTNHPLLPQARDILCTMRRLHSYATKLLIFEEDRWGRSGN
ncbi:MAG: hypothetical protein JSS43_16610 [Proteobacteria bacterium]|nr:hypothetical protein [Pseudomonadota bacterium]